MECDFEVRMVIGQFDVLSFESQIEIFLAKVEIVVDPSNFFTALPSIAKNFDEDIGKKQVAFQLSYLDPKIHFLKDDSLASGGLYLYEVITAQAFMSDPLQSIAD